MTEKEAAVEKAKEAWLAAVRAAEASGVPEHTTALERNKEWVPVLEAWAEVSRLAGEADEVTP